MVRSVSERSEPPRVSNQALGLNARNRPVSEPAGYWERAGKHKRYTSRDWAKPVGAISDGDVGIGYPSYNQFIRRLLNQVSL